MSEGNKCPTCGQKLPPSVLADLKAVLEYNMGDEQQDWELTGRDPKHIYMSLWRLNDWLDHPKVQVLVGTMGGLVEPDPEVFFEEKDALEARKELDAKLDIVRDHDGNYEHPENSCVLYEIEIK